MDREEARVQREAAAADARVKSKEQKVARKKLIDDVRAVQSLHGMMELLGAVDPKELDIHIGRWETTMILVERHPWIVFGLKDQLFTEPHQTAFDAPLMMGFNEEVLKGKVFWHMDGKILGQLYPVEDSVPAIPDPKGEARFHKDEIQGYRFVLTKRYPDRPAVQEVLNQWIREISEKMGGKKMVESHIGLGPIPDDLIAGSHLPLLDGLRVDFGQLEYMERPHRPTESFCLRVTEGCEGMQQMFIERLVKHNTEAWPLPKGPQLVVVKGEAGCITWDPESGYEDLKIAITMSEHYMSYFIGPKGTNIRELEKRIAGYRRGDAVKITPVCLPGSPQIPVIFTTSRILEQGEVGVLVDFIDEKEAEMYPDSVYDAY